MNFAIASERKGILREFSKLLFTAFPGSTIYEIVNESEAIECVREHSVDAVFVDGDWDSENEFSLLEELQTKGTALPIYVFADDDSLEDAATLNGASGYIVRPADADKLREHIIIDGENTDK